MTSHDGWLCTHVVEIADAHLFSSDLGWADAVASAVNDGDAGVELAVAHEYNIERAGGSYTSQRHTRVHTQQHYCTYSVNRQPNSDDNSKPYTELKFIPTAGNGTNLWIRSFIAGLSEFARLIKALKPTWNTHTNNASGAQVFMKIPWEITSKQTLEYTYSDRHSTWYGADVTNHKSWGWCWL